MAIEPSKICNVRKSNISNNVLHSCNDAIIYYARTESQANEFLEQWEEFKDSFKDRGGLNDN